MISDHKLHEILEACGERELVLDMAAELLAARRVVEAARHLSRQICGDKATYDALDAYDKAVS